MSTTSRPRRPSVWTVLCLQTVLTAVSVYTCVQILAFWSHYAAMHTQLLVREIVPASILAVSLIGLWNDKSWGWILALVADGILCAETLWFILNYPGLARSSRFLAFNILEFAAVAVLPYTPVRDHFFRRQPSPATTYQVRLQNSASLARKWVRIVIYFAMAILATCACTAFSLAVFLGQKSGGEKGFLLLVLVGITTGGVASLLFALMLTAVSRRFGSTRVWVWLLFGALLAPGSIVTLGALGRFLDVGVLHFVFWGPAALVQVWWLTAPTGIITGWICYLMYPWAYPVSANTGTPISASLES